MNTHRFCGKLLSRDQWVLLSRPLYLRILTRLIEERNAIPLTPVIAVFLRSFDTMERALEPIVRPAHEQIANVADNGARLKLHLGPRLTGRPLRDHLPTRAYLQARLALALEEQRQEAPVDMRTGTMVYLAIFRRLEVVQQAQHGLRVRARDVVRFHEVVVGEPEAPGETRHQLLRHALQPVHEAQGLRLEPGQVVVADPLVLHVLAELQLVRLLLVRRAGGRPDLGLELVAHVLRTPRHASLCCLREVEERLGGLEHGVHFVFADAVVHYGEEPDLLGCGAELPGDLVTSLIEVG